MTEFTEIEVASLGLALPPQILNLMLPSFTDPP